MGQEQMITTPSGAQFEISVDGKPRSYRDTKAAAVDAAEFFKGRNPNSNIAVKDFRTGEVTLAQAAYGPPGSSTI